MFRLSLVCRIWQDCDGTALLGPKYCPKHLQSLILYFVSPPASPPTALRSRPSEAQKRPPPQKSPLVHYFYSRNTISHEATLRSFFVLTAGSVRSAREGLLLTSWLTLSTVCPGEPAPRCFHFPTGLVLRAEVRDQGICLRSLQVYCSRHFVFHSTPFLDYLIIIK